MSDIGDDGLQRRQRIVVIATTAAEAELLLKRAATENVLLEQTFHGHGEVERIHTITMRPLPDAETVQEAIDSMERMRKAVAAERGDNLPIWKKHREHLRAVRKRR